MVHPVSEQIIVEQEIVHFVPGRVGGLVIADLKRMERYLVCQIEYLPLLPS